MARLSLVSTVTGLLLLCLLISEQLIPAHGWRPQGRFGKRTENGLGLSAGDDSAFQENLHRWLKARQTGDHPALPEIQTPYFRVADVACVAEQNSLYRCYRLTGEEGNTYQ